eukprot:Hpha_TRINITY_DN9567_c0_g1::TRINITY_DN9567_c0_g1_i1::g.114821::m.114821
MAPSQWVFHPQAYGKAYMHTFKYPSQALCGFFIGKTVKDGQVMYVHDTFPLFHTHLQLHCMLDVALAQVQELAKTGYSSQSGGWSVVGYYAAEARLEEESPTPWTDRVGKLIAAEAQGGRGAFVAQFSNSQVTPEPRDFAFRIFNSHNMTQAIAGGGVQDDRLRFGYLDAGNVPRDVVDGTTAVMERLKSVLVTDPGAVDRVVDFEAHLEQLDLDITNADLAATLTAQIVPVPDP